MREPIKDLSRLYHILEQINNIDEFVSNKSYEQLVNDKILQYALTKAIEIIGEAAYMLSEEFKNNHPQTPWLQIINMRHVLVHGYYHITMPLLWATVNDDIPQLRPQIETYIKELA